jgi:2-polyprenyl-3-methyl-5-hydroxy-6-metoxy-1,4-benzoquinol methylase
MLKVAKQSVKNLLNRYPQWICKQEFDLQKFKGFNERPIEFSFVFRKLGEIYPRKILDVGSGKTALPYMMRNCGFLVTAIDNVRDYWPSGMINRHYHVIDDDITDTRLSDTFDLITCVSVIEHIHNFDDAIRNMFSLLKTNGHLLLTFPYNEESYVENVYELPEASYGQRASYITQSYARKELDRWLQMNNGSILDQEYWQFWEGDHWTVGKQLIPPKRVTADDKHQLTCLLIRKG